MRKNIAIESTKVAAVNARANQRAIDFGVASTASAPITGSRIIQVRSLVNITVLLSLLHKCDQHNDDCGQYRNTAEETDHVGLHPASLDMSQVASQCRHQASRPIDQAVNDVGIEGLLDMRDTQHDVADQQVVEFVHVVLAQQYTMQHAQHRVALYKSVDLRQVNTRIQRVGPGKTHQRDNHTHPGFPISHQRNKVKWTSI